MPEYATLVLNEADREEIKKRFYDIYPEEYKPAFGDLIATRDIDINDRSFYPHWDICDKCSHRMKRATGGCANCSIAFDGIVLIPDTNRQFKNWFDGWIKDKRFVAIYGIVAQNIEATDGLFAIRLSVNGVDLPMVDLRHNWKGEEGENIINWKPEDGLRFKRYIDGDITLAPQSSVRAMISTEKEVLTHLSLFGETYAPRHELACC